MSAPTRPEDQPMVMAVVRNGEVRPLEPLPPEWQDGQRVRIEKAADGEPSADSYLAPNLAKRKMAIAVVMIGECGSGHPGGASKVA